ncbi:hypothetical protein [Xenorhabdus griffiniae]|uniref:hypothetical protein n=1 Tax=Xenorhabdus griffiniae TaxID=351672 RepID=UPI002359C42C|nr:hypothetical protein [Xenorhabdus griffiniae]MDC9605960.1 hypothetical protein [Xenorhabdus griffiniae]
MLEFLTPRAARGKEHSYYFETPFTTKVLEQIGVRDTSKITMKEYPDVPVISKGWNKYNAYFKAEGEQINVGLGKGKALDVFNENI